MMKFPCVCSFQIRRDAETKEQTVFAVEVKGKSKLENKKFVDVKSYFWDGSDSAVIAVSLVNSEEELKTELYDLSQFWSAEQ